MKPKLINIDISEINHSHDFINEEISKRFISELEKASINLPDFDKYASDIVCIPIVEEPKVLVNNSVYPDENYLTKMIWFRKNYKKKSWIFFSKNFN